MDNRLRGKGTYSIKDIMSYTSKENLWIMLDNLLEQDYELTKVLIENSPNEGWGINYRVGKNSLCYIHPEKDSFLLSFQVREEGINEIKNSLSQYAINLWNNRYPCGRGGWIWYKVTDIKQLDEVRLLLNIKIKPNKRG